jgi:hypothetical protein
MSDQAVSCSVSSDTEITSIQWHPKLNNTLLFGEAAGTVISVEISGAVSGSNRLKASKRRIEFKSDAMKSLNVNGDAVCDIKFDPNSDNYALIAFSSGKSIFDLSYHH